MFTSARKRNRRKPESAAPRISFDALKPVIVGGIRPALAVCALLIGGGVVAWGLMLSFDQPIGKVEVGGQFQRVAPVQIEEVVAPFRGAGFLSIDLDALRAALQGIPWVDHARVERRWPNGIRVFITEHVAAARWRPGLGRAKAHRSAGSRKIRAVDVVASLGFPHEGADDELRMVWCIRSDAIRPVQCDGDRPERSCVQDPRRTTTHGADVLGDVHLSVL